ncbi:MAG: S8 family serine peptidase, partial [Acidobacteria bacterium]|nr:S8 family serine peptidase [Acidobacteriota bacterium]
MIRKLNSMAFCMPMALVAILAITTITPAAGLAFGAEPGKTKKLRNDDRPRPDKPAVRVPSVPAEETRVLNFEPVYVEPLQRAIEPVFLENDMSWYPHQLKPPFGQDLGSDKPWMIYAGAARISAQRSAAPVAIPDALKIGAPLGSIETFYIVHFEGKIQSEWKDAVIKAGAISSETYLSNHALVFRMTPQVFKVVEAIPEVDWIGYYEPAYKISPRIGRMPVDATTRALAGTSLLVGLHGRVDPEAVRSKLEALGLNVITDIKGVKAEKHAPTPWTPWILHVDASRDKALQIAAIEEVQFVWEPATVKSFRAFSSGAIMQSGSNAPWFSLGSNDPTVSSTFFPLWFRGLQGQHQMVGIADTGVDYGTGELFDDPVNPLDPGTSCAGGGPACFLTGNLKVPKGSLRDGSTDVCDINNGHGTGVTGSCCQDSHPNSTTESREPNQAGRGEFGEGISHEAQVVFAPFGWSFFDPINQRLQWLDLATFGASVMNTSIVWLTGTGPTYDDQSWVYDTVIDTAEANGDHMLITNAAGNDGVCGTWDTGSDSAGWAKNAVDVGASDDLAQFDEMYSFGGAAGSNKGPDWTNPPGAASDDLIFPDIVAPGAGDSNNALDITLTARADGTCGNNDQLIQGFGGTSGSAPVVAGTIALIHQYYEEGNQPPITDPSAALMKATLINSAEAMDSLETCMGRGVPSGEQGWGRPNLSNVLAFNDTTFEMNAFDVLNAGGFDSSGQFDEYNIVITDTGQPLRVTMVYTDVPGNFFGQGRPYIVNDLDRDVMKMHEAVLIDPEAVMAEMHRLPVSRSVYEHIRVVRETPGWQDFSLAERAARMIYLFGCAFNANPRSSFVASSMTPLTFGRERDLRPHAQKLRTATLESLDWSRFLDRYIMEQKKLRCLLFADPPYVVTARADHYRHRFGYLDHILLAHKLTRINGLNGGDRSVKIMVTYDDDKAGLIRALYREEYGWHLE